MDYNVTLPRLALFLAALAVFWLLDGFAAPVVKTVGTIDRSRIHKAWSYCVMLYIVGSVAISFVDHYVGNIDRTNIRVVYIIIGFIAMLGSVLWLRSLQATVQAALVQ